MYIFRRSCFKDKNEVKSFLDTKDDSEKEGVINAINLSVLSDVLNRGGLTTEAKKAEKYKELFENSVGRQTFRIGLFKHKVNSPAYVNAQRNKFKTLSGKKDNSPSVSLNCFMRDLFDATLGESSYSIFDVPAGFILLKDKESLTDEQCEALARNYKIMVNNAKDNKNDELLMYKK